jgi:hypothetical protein
MMEVFETLVTWRDASGVPDDARRKFAIVGSGKLLPETTTVVGCVALPTEGDATPATGHE